MKFDEIVLQGLGFAAMGLAFMATSIQDSVQFVMVALLFAYLASLVREGRV